MVEGNAPLISVVCLTYNQEQYVAQTIEGFLGQRTEFPFEIIVHDDASTDRTREILLDFQARYPGRMSVVLQVENQHSRGRRVAALALSYAKGDLVAYCEGDDYWIDPCKLQLQTEYLLAHPEVGAVFTDADRLYERRNRRIRSYDRFTRKRVGSGDVRVSLLTTSPFTTCTAMFRRALVDDYVATAERLDARMDDYVMWLSIAAKARIAYLARSTATYRIREGSLSHFRDFASVRRFCRSGLRISMYFNAKFGNLVDVARLREVYRRRMLEHCLSFGLYRRGARYTRNVVEYVTTLAKVRLRKLLL